MVNIVSIASELGYISLPDNILIDVDQLKNYPDEKTVIITTEARRVHGRIVPHGIRHAPQSYH